MFKQRLLTTLGLVPLVLLAIYCGPSLLLAGILLFVVALSGFEWTKLIPIKPKQLERKLVFILAVLFMTWLTHYALYFWLAFSFVIWFLVLVAVLTYPQSEQYWGRGVIVGAVGLLFLSLFSNAFVGIYQYSQGKNLIVYVLFLIWATDIGAYLTGKCWGRYKLLPKVSPGKTLEGSLGGIGLALLVAIIGAFVFKPDSHYRWFILALLTVLISMLGDLVISMLKRRCHLKDSGHIIPGHGGILDRLDSSIAALPLFYYGLSLLGLGH
jgi:phosphatidate cytidylyltransferase